MDEAPNQPAENDFELDGAIDDLLDEIDSAVVEEQSQEPEPEAEPEPSDAQPAVDPIEPDAQADPAGQENSSEIDAGANALETLDAIEGSADALLDDAIGSLLGEDEAAEPSAETVAELPTEAAAQMPEDIPEAASPQDTPPEAEQPEAEQPEAIVQAEPDEATVTGDAPSASIDDLADELEAVAEELASEPAAETPEESQAEPIVESDPVMAADAPSKVDTTPIDSTPEPLNDSAAATKIPHEDHGVIEDLDDALASAADDLLDGDFETAEGDLVEATTVDYAVDPSLLLDKEEPPTPPAAEATPASAPAPAAETESEAEAKAEASPATAPDSPVAPTPAGESKAQGTPQATPEPAESRPQPASPPAAEPATPAATATPAPVPAPAVAAAAIAAPDADSAPAAEPGVSVFTKLSHTMSPIADKAVTAAGPTGAKVVLMLASPLADKSPETRNAVGWVALWTMFLAVIVWGYALLFNSAAATTPTQAPSRMVDTTPAPGVTLSHEP